MRVCEFLNCIFHHPSNNKGQHTYSNLIIINRWFSFSFFTLSILFILFFCFLFIFFIHFQRKSQYYLINLLILFINMFSFLLRANKAAWRKTNPNNKNKTKKKNKQKNTYLFSSVDSRFLWIYISNICNCQYAMVITHFFFIRIISLHFISEPKSISNIMF